MHPDAGFSKLPDADIAEPDIGIVVLESDMSFPLEILQSSAKLVLRALAIGILLRLGPTVQIHIDDLLAVKHNADLIILSGNRDVVPLAVLSHFLAGSQSIVNRATAMPARLIDTFIDLYFDTGLDAILWIVGAKEDTAVTLGLELQIENEIAEALFSPDHAGFGPAGQHIIFDYPSGTRLAAAVVLPLAQVGAVKENLPSAFFGLQTGNVSTAI